MPEAPFPAAMRQGFDPEEFARRIREPTPCAEDGMVYDGTYPHPAWTPRGFVLRGDRLVLVCTCGHRADAPLQKLVDAGKGDLPLVNFSGKWLCAACGAKAISLEVPR